MDTGKSWYVFRYFGHLMTAQERLAYSHLIGTAKDMQGRTDWAAQTEARNRLSRLPSHLPRHLSDDAEVLNLTREGMNVFVARTAQRILDEHRAEVRFNYCCRCGGLARTPVCSVTGEVKFQDFKWTITALIRTRAAEDSLPTTPGL